MKANRLATKESGLSKANDVARDRGGWTSVLPGPNAKGLVRKQRWALFLAAITVALGPVGSASATPASGFTGTTVVKGVFPEFMVVNHLTREQLQKLAPTFTGDTWLALQKTQGPSDMYVQTNTWEAGGSTGWHRHPGHSLIIITSGEVTIYEPDCTKQVYGPGTANGSTFVDTGNDDHLMRNEGASAATGFAVQLVASGAQRRIDEPAPPTCSLR